MKDFAHERLPRGYELYETVDLAGKAMKVMAIFVVLLTLGMVLWGILLSGHPVSEAFQMEAFRIAFATTFQPNLTVCSLPLFPRINASPLPS